MNVFLYAYVRLKACRRICTWKSTPSNQKHNLITSTVFTTTFGDTYFPATSGLKHFPTGSQPSFKFGRLEPDALRAKTCFVDREQTTRPISRLLSVCQSLDCWYYIFADRALRQASEQVRTKAAAKNLFRGSWAEHETPLKVKPQYPQTLLLCANFWWVMELYWV